MPTKKYEERDAHVRPIIYFAVALTLMIVIVMAGLSGGLSWIEKWANQKDKSSFYQTGSPALNPSPLLETTPGFNYQQLRAEEDAILLTYGWTDRNQNKIRIPIAQALEIASKEGLPARKTPLPGKEITS